MTESKPSKRIEREARLRWLPLGNTRISPLAQRDLKKSRVNYLIANFNVENIGTPTANERDGHFYLMDGQHRTEALKHWLGEGWEVQQVQCWTYTGLTEQQEAETFLQMNDVLGLTAFPKFRIAVEAGRDVETDIDRIVRAQGLHISSGKTEGAVGAVTTLIKVYEHGGPATLSRTLRIARDAFGTPGMEGAVLDGIGLVCGRYNGQLDDDKAVQQLSSMLGGVNGLLNGANDLRKKSGRPRSQCVAATAVAVINRGKGKKLANWWQDGSVG